MISTALAIILLSGCIPVALEAQSSRSHRPPLSAGSLRPALSWVSCSLGHSWAAPAAGGAANSVQSHLSPRCHRRSTCCVTRIWPPGMQRGSEIAGFTKVWGASCVLMASAGRQGSGGEKDAVSAAIANAELLKDAQQEISSARACLGAPDPAADDVERVVASLSRLERRVDEALGDYQLADQNSELYNELATAKARASSLQADLRQLIYSQPVRVNLPPLFAPKYNRRGISETPPRAGREGTSGPAQVKISSRGMDQRGGTGDQRARRSAGMVRKKTWQVRRAGSQGTMYVNASPASDATGGRTDTLSLAQSQEGEWLARGQVSGDVHGQRPPRQQDAEGDDEEEELDEEGMQMLLEDGERLLAEARAYLGLVNPSPDDARSVEVALDDLQRFSRRMLRILERAGTAGRQGAGGGDVGGGEVARLQDLLRKVGDLEELVRQLMYNMPAPAPRAGVAAIIPGLRLPWLDSPFQRESPRSSKPTRGASSWSRTGDGGRRLARAYLPKDLRNVRRLGQLLDVLEPYIGLAERGGGRAKDAAIALNHLKRLQWQAADDDARAAQVEGAMLRLAAVLLATARANADGGQSDSAALEPKHIALALNALADRCLGPSGRKSAAAVQVGRVVPADWKEGCEVVWGGGEVGQGDVVVVRRSDGSLRVAEVQSWTVEGGGGAREQVAVRVSVGARGSSMARVERADALGWVTVPLVENANARRAACRTLGEIAMQQDLVRYCIPQDLATVLWAQARMSVLNRPLVNAVLERALHPVTLRKARARDLATMLWALGQLSVRDGQAVQEMARALVMGLQAERSAGGQQGLQGLQGAVNGQDVSNALWAFARLGLCEDAVARTLLRLAAVLSSVQRGRQRDGGAGGGDERRDPGSWSVQAVSNVLWAAAELALPDSNERESTENGVRDTCWEIAAVAAEGVKTREGWTVQGAATTLWALGVLRITQSPLADLLLQVVSAKSHLLDDADFCQLHQFFLAAGVAVGGSEVKAEAELRERSAVVFELASRRMQTRSEAQREMARVAREELLLGIEEEAIVEGLGYSVDVLVPALNVCLEFDGPTHFITDLGTGADARFNGATRLKTELLQQHGFCVVRVGYSEWDQLMLQDVPCRAEWLSKRIQEARRVGNS